MSYLVIHGSLRSEIKVEEFETITDAWEFVMKSDVCEHSDLLRIVQELSPREMYRRIIDEEESKKPACAGMIVPNIYEKPIEDYH